MGNKILRQRLKGPSVAKYYPIATVKKEHITKAFPELDLVDYEEIQRLNDVEARRRRGKGPPAKIKKKQVSAKSSGVRKKK